MKCVVPRRPDSHRRRRLTSLVSIRLAKRCERLSETAHNRRPRSPRRPTCHRWPCPSSSPANGTSLWKPPTDWPRFSESNWSAVEQQTGGERRRSTPATRRAGPSPCSVYISCRVGQVALRRAGPLGFLDVSRWWAGARSELVPPYVEKGDGPARFALIVVDGPHVMPGHHRRTSVHKLRLARFAGLFCWPISRASLQFVRHFRFPFFSASA